MCEETDAGAVCLHPQLALGRRQKTRAQPEQCRLPGAVRAGDDEEAAVLEVEVELLQDAFLPEAA